MSPSESGTALTNPATSVASAAAMLRAKPLLHYKDLGLNTQSRKVKFTCVHASDNFLACGTNAGSVYLYATTVARADASDSRARTKYHLVKMITPPSNDRVGVACLSICPMQKHLVVGTLRGVVYGLQLSDYNKIGEKVEFSHDFHAGFPVTYFLWDKLGHRLFSACNAGLVCQTVIRAGMSAIFGSADTELLLKEETGIVQLDMAKYGRSDVLLVSSQLRVLLLNLTASGGSAVQIGTKARQGSYGACFFTKYDEDSIDPAKKQENMVFSSRPGRRVWIADPQTGTVSSTIKFSLSKNPASFIQSPECTLEEGIQPRNLTINKLSLFQFIQEPPFVSDEYKARSKTLLVSWNIGSSVLFFLDPIAVEIVEWHLDLGIIHDLKIMNESTLVILHGESPKVSMVQSCTVRQFLDIYGANDVKKSVQLAIEFNMNDVSIVKVLRAEWIKLSGESQDPEDAKLTEALDALYEKAKLLEEQHMSANEIESSKSGSQPLQVIFKHRPQQQGSYPSDSLVPSSVSIEDKSVTLATGSTLHKQVEYFDVLAPSFQSYSKSIYTPDGSTIEACMVDINELPRNTPVVRDDYRESFLEEVMEEVKKFEQSRSEDNMNLLPTLNLKGNSIAAAKAFSTYLPSTSMLTSLMDPSAISQHLGRAQMSSMFGEYSDVDEPVVIDPDPRLLRRTYTRPIMQGADTSHEYSVLRIAMSSKGEVDDGNLDTEVLLEAISMDIYDTNLKYTSNLPLDQQFDLPEDAEGRASSVERTSENEKKSRTHSVQTRPQNKHLDITIRDAKDVQKDSMKTKAEVIRDLRLQSPVISAVRTLNGGTQNGFLLERQNSVSPNPSRAAQRALQKFIGATPSCEITRKCMVGGYLALSPEIEPVLKREVVELSAELHSAAATAEKTKKLAQRLWPAAGITRVCACLTSLYLFQGDLSQVQVTIDLWLSCFDPTAKPAEQGLSPSTKKPSNGVRKSASGFARGEALVDGDGLPLTRGDWNLVRVMVSIYFAISAAGNRLHVRPMNSESLLDGDGAGRSKLYAHEMGVTLDLEERFNWADDATDDAPKNQMLAAPRLWTSDETEAFVNKYGAYLNPELAAEVCNLRLFSNALNLVLDRAVSSPEMSDACDEIVNWIAEKDIPRAISALRERDSICILLHLLDVLLKKCPQDAIEMCVEKYPVLYPWNVERSLFGAKIDWNEQEQKGELFKPEIIAQTSKYFRYLARLLEEKGDEAGKDTLVVNRCLQLCFGGAKVVDKFFEESNRSGLASWIASIVRQPGKFRFDHAKCWALFTKNHLLEGLLELSLLSLKCEATRARGFTELHELVAIIVQKKQLRALESVFQKVSKLEASCNMEEILLKVLGQIEKCVSIENRNEELSSTVIYALLNCVTLQYGMHLLSRYPLLFAATPLSMYHTIVENHVLTSRQMHEVNQMLEVVDTHVWSSYKDASSSALSSSASSGGGISFAPQISAILQLETGALRPGIDDKSFEMWKAKCVQYEQETREYQEHNLDKSLVRHGESSSTPLVLSPLKANSTLACRSFEYRNSDWGGEVQLHDSTCAACELPVVVIADDNANLEVLLLPCGHAFHSMCLDDDSCPMCLEDNLETLDWY